MAIITISRGSLSGGRRLAECLARHLRCRTLADEVVLAAAESLGASPEAVRERFETPPRLWERLTKERTQYVLAVQAALSDACLGGSLVYHGLAGQFLLRGLPATLRVRLIAPTDMRIAALREQEPDLSTAKAEAYIRDVDRNRARRVRLLFDADVEDPSFYDLTVNLLGLSVETACEAVAEVASAAEFAVTAEVEARIADFAAGCSARLDAARSVG